MCCFYLKSACPNGRPPRPSNKQEVITWYKELEAPKGAGINKTTRLPVDYFHGNYSYFINSIYLFYSVYY